MQLASAPSLDGFVLLRKALSSCMPEPASLCGLQRERGGPCEPFQIFNLLNNNPGQGATFCCMLSAADANCSQRGSGEAKHYQEQISPQCSESHCRSTINASTLMFMETVKHLAKISVQRTSACMAPFAETLLR